MPSIKIKNYIFKPTLIPSLVTVVLLYLLISLGYWQLDRANYKANLESSIESRISSQPVTLETLDLNDSTSLYQPVITYGDYDNSHVILLDNQVDNMAAGYHVYTPLKLRNNTAILVNRGWIKQSSHRSDLPAIPEITDSVELSGYLIPPPSAALILSQNANNYSKWPAILQFINMTEIENKLGYELLPVVLLLNTAEQTSFVIQPIRLNMRSEKHQAYAFQWFALALALFIIYVTVNSKKSRPDKPDITEKTGS